MWEFSWRPASVNFLDTITRREEEYHRKIFEEKRNEDGCVADGVKSIHDIELNVAEELKDYVIYDRYRRGGA